MGNKSNNPFSVGDRVIIPQESWNKAATRLQAQWQKKHGTKKTLPEEIITRLLGSTFTVQDTKDDNIKVVIRRGDLTADCWIGASLFELKPGT